MCTSLEFNEFFGSSFDVPCFVFSSFVVQFSRYRFATALCDSLFSISYSVPFVKGFSKLFSSFFSTFSFAPSRNFLLLFAFSLSSLSLGHRLPCGALLYYHFLPLLSTPFCTFFPFFPLFLPFLFDVSRFLEVFDRFLGVWMEGGGSFGGVFRPLFADARFDKPRNFQKVLIGFVRRCWLGALLRGLQNLDSARRNGGFADTKLNPFAALRRLLFPTFCKVQKVGQKNFSACGGVMLLTQHSCRFAAKLKALPCGTARFRQAPMRAYRTHECFCPRRLYNNRCLYLHCSRTNRW